MRVLHSVVMMDVVSEAVREDLIVLELFSPLPGWLQCVQQVHYDGVVVVLGCPHTVTSLSPLPFNLELLTMHWWLDS